MKLTWIVGETSCGEVDAQGRVQDLDFVRAWEGVTLWQGRREVPVILFHRRLSDSAAGGSR